MPEPNTKSTILPLLLALFFIAMGVVSRFALVDSPNFKPVCALALFAGFYFGRVWAGVAVAAIILIVSDLLLGGYDFGLMLAVYGSTGLAACLGVMIQKWQSVRPSPPRLFGQFAVASLTMSVAFFLLTNFAVWACSSWYDPTLAGLTQCYVAAIPFFRWTLCSNLLFAQILVAAYVGGLALLGHRLGDKVSVSQ